MVTYENHGGGGGQRPRLLKDPERRPPRLGCHTSNLEHHFVSRSSMA